MLRARCADRRTGQAAAAAQLITDPTTGLVTREIARSAPAAAADSPRLDSAAKVEGRRPRLRPGRPAAAWADDLAMTLSRIDGNHAARACSARRARPRAPETFVKAGRMLPWAQYDRGSTVHIAPLRRGRRRGGKPPARSATPSSATRLSATLRLLAQKDVAWPPVAAGSPAPA
jgi:hypothetical protein